MNITVYGLGIIGASVCASLKRAGHKVSGMNRSRKPLEYALERGYIDEVAQTFEGAEVVVLALPPRICMKLLDEAVFPEDCIVTDICGVKSPLEDVVYSKPRDYRYVGMHPMAGKEASGIASASVSLFDGKNLIITNNRFTEHKALCVAEKLGKDMGFSRIVECSAEEHDKMIALTSQLAHIASNAYVKSPLTADCIGFTGGSFQDMTRVAGVDEEIWTELFFLNRENLLREIDRLCLHLTQYKEALEQRDEIEMKSLLREGKETFAQFLRKE